MESDISFHVKETCRVLLKVFDLQGREITTLTNNMYPTGKHRVLFDGQGLPTGIYFYQIRMRDFQEMRKMILTK